MTVLICLPGNIRWLLNGFIFDRNIWLTKVDNANLDKEIYKQGFDFSPKTKQSNKIEKKIELDSKFLSKKYE